MQFEPLPTFIHPNKPKYYQNWVHEHTPLIVIKCFLNFEMMKVHDSASHATPKTLHIEKTARRANNKFILIEKMRRERPQHKRSK